MTAVPEEGPFAAPPLVYLVQPEGSEYRVLQESEVKGVPAPELDSSESRPVAYLFQPTGYQVVPPERLQEWEQMMTERVGLTPSRGDEAPGRQRSALPSVSFCCEGGGISMSCACDCDEI
jgi:hypothetical protein